MLDSSTRHIILRSVTVETTPAPAQTRTTNALAASSVFAAAVSFGLVAGLVEGCGLLIFQRLNWRRWGPMVHVSKEIIWISPLADVLLFAALAGVAIVVGRFFRRPPTSRILVFAFTFLAVYDWLTLTERLYHRACLLLALGVAVAFARWFSRRRDRVAVFWRESLVWLLAVWLLVFVGMKGGEWLHERHQLASLPPAPATAPNLLIIVIDTLRADHVSAYGYTRATTPHIDQLASQSVLFENAISACSWTLPSHASLLTGRYPSDHGMGNAEPIPWFGWGDRSLRGYLTLGEALEKHGYRTGAFSANQSYFTSNVGLGRGFIHFEDYFHSAEDMFLRTLFGREFERAYLHRTEKSLVTRAIRFFGLSGLLDHRKHADEVNREALTWIDQSHRPFLAFLNYIDVHDQAPPQDFHAPWGLGTEIDRYDSAVNYDDAEIGNLMSELQRRGLTQNTIVIVTSDHGESLGQHDMQFHGIALYREQIHVPLLVWSHSNIPAGTLVSRPVSNAAIAATIMDLIGDTNQRPFPGSGLDPLWARSDTEAHWPYPVSELAKNDIVIDPDRRARAVEPTAMDGDMKSLVTSQWHYIVHEELGEQLYDWVDDPGETKNLINTAQGKAARKDLASEIKAQSTP